MATIPGVVGGEFRAVILPRRLPESAQGYLLRLCCTETPRTSSDDGPSNTVLFEDEQTVLRELQGEDGELAIPVLFQIPYDAPTTEVAADRDKRMWKLSVKALTAGHHYRAEFEVPICRTAASSPHHNPPARPPYLAPADPWGPVRATGIRVEDLDAGGHRITFPRRRHLGFGIALLVVQAVFLAAIGGGVYYYWKSGWIPVAAFLGACQLWAVLDLLLFQSEVVMTSAGYTVRSGWLGWGSARTLALAEIQELTLTPAGSWGNTVAMDLRAKLKSGSAVLLAKRIIPQAAAELLKKRMNQR